MALRKLPHPLRNKVESTIDNLMIFLFIIFFILDSPLTTQTIPKLNKNIFETKLLLFYSNYEDYFLLIFINVITYYILYEQFELYRLRGAKFGV